MKLSDNIRIIRKENNLSQEQLAEQLGVSRQAVSKWESGQSYPEMDKVLLICKMFNYNIDELMNENVKEVSEAKQSKININKYIDDFFGFITKTVNMFAVMRFRDRVKCLFENLFGCIMLIALFVILSAIGGSLFANTFGALPYNVYRIVKNILEAFFTILYLIIGITVLLHIFKIRYLDYYEVVRQDEEQEENKNSETAELNETKRVVIEKNKEKIIIRDPDHSQSKFLTGIIKFVLLCIKGIAVILGISFSFSFIGLVTLLVLSFLFAKIGMLFLGGLLGIISALLINFIILQTLYNFIVNKKNHKTRIGILLLCSLILAGISIGIFLIGVTELNIVEETNGRIEDIYNIEMTDDLSINERHNSIEYIETDSNELKIVVTHSKYEKTDLVNANEVVYIYTYQDNSKFMEYIRDFIENINKKQIVNYYDNATICVYTSKDNIKKLKQNND